MKLDVQSGVANILTELAKLGHPFVAYHAVVERTELACPGAPPRIAVRAELGCSIRGPAP